MGYILKVKDDKGNVIGIPAIQGEKGGNGADGKSAYDIARENGFVGTEAEWLATHCRGIHFGTSAPTSSLGDDGDVYLMYAEE